jgi:malate dehydrogenase (oxaloacetate-decarboxylating)
MATEEELLAKAEAPSKEAMRLHPFYRGKVQMVPKCIVRDISDFDIWYSPGVAEPCMDISRNPDKVYEHTNKGNSVAVITDGTRVLGLGDIGPEASLPVMEGKALIYKYLGGVDSIAIPLKTKDHNEFISVVKNLEPAFGGINLEDISHPKCFVILKELRESMNIPVWHDDQQGTATITLSGLLNALKVVGKPIDQVKIAFIGAGASNVAITRLIFAAGADPQKCTVVDSKGILHTGRTDLETKRDWFADKWNLCNITNAEGRTGDIAAAMKGVDVLIAMSTPGPGVIHKEWVSSMAKDSIVFTCANPVPEIWPWESKEAGARIVATGRSDFPNQVNNSMCFPGIFRGALDVWATTITDEMCIASARELAKFAEEQGLSEDHIVPNMEDWEAFPREAAAVAMKAQEQGVARRTTTWDEEIKLASSIISGSRNLIDDMMKYGHIPPPPKA